MRYTYRAPRDDEATPMSMNERIAWVSLTVLVVTTVVYAVLVVPEAVRGPVGEARWVAPMLGAVGASVVATGVGSFLATLGGAARLAARGRGYESEFGSDARDKEIGRLGTRSTARVLAAGLVVVTVLAMVGADPFWIGNAAFAAGLAAAVTEAAVKIRAYRRGF